MWQLELYTFTDEVLGVKLSTTFVNFDNRRLREEVRLVDGSKEADSLLISG